MSNLTDYPRDIVLFIGAGFSKEAGLPVMTEFGSEARKDHKGLARHLSADEDSKEFRHAARLLVDAATTFEHFQELLRKAYTLKDLDINNIETVFGIAEVLGESDQRNVCLDGQPYSIDQLVIDIQLWLWKVYQQLPLLNPNQKTAREVYDRFFERLTPPQIARRLSVLTTNCDILFEYFSWKHGRSCAYPIFWDKTFAAGHGCEPYVFQADGAEDKAIVCKLHGSVNFFENRSAADNLLYVSADLGDKNRIGKSGVWEQKPALMAVDAIWNIRKKYGDGFTPTIIPPSYAKLGRRTWLRKLWKEAFEALKNANIIIFIGYSIPDSDGFMRSLVHGAMSQRSCDLLPSVYVVDPCGKVHVRYWEIFGSSLKGFKPQDLKTAINGELSDLFDELT